MVTFAHKVLITIGIILGVILFAAAIFFVLPHFTPFIIAFFIALMLEPANNWMIKHGKIKRVFAVNISFFIFLGSVLLLSYFIITKITIEMVAFIKNIQRNIPQIQNYLSELYYQSLHIIEMAPKEVADQIYYWFNNLLTNIQTSNIITTIGGQTYNLTTAIPNLFFIMILIFVSLYLFSINLPNIKHKFYSFFSDKSAAKAKIILLDLRNATIGFLQAQVILSTITYFISLIGLLILDIRFALAISLLIIVVDILPILGTGSVLVPWAVFSITQGNLFVGIGLIVLFIVITVVRRIIEPRILGEKIGLSSLATLISIWVGFKALGVVGVFLGPLLIILYLALVKAEVIRFKLKI